MRLVLRERTGGLPNVQLLQQAVARLRVVPTAPSMPRFPSAALTALLLPVCLLAFEPPSPIARMEALGSLDQESAVSQRLLAEDVDFSPIRRPGISDWLAFNNERGQTFSAYCRSGFLRPGKERGTIYLLPMGEFSDDSSPSLEDLRVYAEAFFQLPVRVLPPLPIAAGDFEPRLHEQTVRRQLRSRAILTYLKARVPDDAYCLLGVTMDDLYPGPGWNYVFGQASLTERVGVYSFARYDPAFAGQKRPEDYRRTALQRSCKVLAHETGHMFGLHHCIYFDCLMNGSNNLAETDYQPQHLCPICLRKLQFNVRFDLVGRYEELAAFYRRQQWDDDAGWTERQLAKAKLP